MYEKCETWNKLNKAASIGDGLNQEKTNYGDGGNFLGLCLAPKMNFCLTIDRSGFKDERKTFEDFKNVSQKLDRQKIFKMKITNYWIWAHASCLLYWKIRNVISKFLPCICIYLQYSKTLVVFISSTYVWQFSKKWILGET